MIRIKIKENGYKLTVPREKILAVLEKARMPYSAQEIHKALKRRVDLASVYRSLKLFTRLGLVMSENIREEKKYFLGHSHHHIVCRICNTIKCVPCSEPNIEVKGFYDIKHELTITGTCKKCSKKI